MKATALSALSALLTASAAGLALAATPENERLVAGSLGIAAVAAGLSLRQLTAENSRPDRATLLLMTQAVVLTQGLSLLTATRGL